MEILEYKKVSQTFRRLASNMLTTKYLDGNIHLIRFRKFIQENQIVNGIIQQKIHGVSFNYTENFIVQDGGWKRFSIPIDEAEHIKAMYDYLIDITNEEEDLRGRAHSFFHSSQSWNDIIRDYLDKAFKPLVDFVIDSLSMEMIQMEPDKNQTYIHQAIENNYGTANIAQRDIHSNNVTNANDIAAIKELLSNIKNTIGDIESIEQEEKESTVDDVDTIEEQLIDENPKIIKIKKAFQGLKKFVSKLPSGVATTTLMVNQLVELEEKLRPFL